MIQQQQQQQQQQMPISVGGGVSVIPPTALAPMQQPVSYVYAGAPSTTTTVTTYLSSQSMGLGVTIVICGALAIIFNGVAIGVHDTLSYVGHGFWCGILMIITGGFGITAAAQKTKCTIITFMVLAIITSIQLLSLLSLGIAGATTNSCSNQCYGYGCYENYYYYNTPCSDKIRTAIAMEALLAILALIAGIACLWGSAICCKAVCCCNYTPAYTLPVMYSTPYAQTVTVYNQQQGAQGPYYPRPQVVPATLASAPPPYVSTGYAVQYWSQQQPAGNNFAYANAPFNSQMPTTSLGAPPPSYNAVGSMQPGGEDKQQ